MSTHQRSLPGVRVSRGHSSWARAVLVGVAALSAASLHAPEWFSVAQAQVRPLPDTEAFLNAVRDNLARSDLEQYGYAYRERRSELHKNPFGRLGTGGMLLYDVSPGEEFGVYFRQLVERDGAALDGEKRERVDRRNRPEENRSVHDVVATLAFDVAGREHLNGRDHVVVRFQPKKDARPHTRQGKMAKAFNGTIWIDEAVREVARVEATAVENLSYGWGIVARLNKGTTISMVREPIDGHLWLPTSIRLVGEGRAILFRKLNLDFAIDWFDYERRLIPPIVTPVADSSGSP